MVFANVTKSIFHKKKKGGGDFMENKRIINFL